MEDKELISLLKTSPEQGIHMLISLYGGSIGTICRNFLYDCSEDDIEEAIADTYIHFWKYRNQFSLKEAYSLKSYLYAIARNAARDKRRALKKKDIYLYSLDELELELVSHENVEKDYEKKEAEAVLHTCLAAMKEPDKTVFLYRYFYGYKIREIGTFLHLEPKKVENILYRGKGKLKKDLIERGICRG